MRTTWRCSASAQPRAAGWKFGLYNDFVLLDCAIPRTILDRPKLMTTEELDALPDDGTERWLIHGELREGELTRRNLSHSEIEANFSGEIYLWRKTQPRPRGKVISGE